MKILKKMTIVFFLAIILLPILKFNFEENSVSKIDNRMLTKNPFSKDSLKGDMTQNIENYISDRIGYRDLMITEYTILNDKVFNKMVHPIYSNGKNGYVFGEGVTTTQEFDDYHIVFAGMIKKFKHIVLKEKFRSCLCLTQQNQLYTRIILQKVLIIIEIGLICFFRS